MVLSFSKEIISRWTRTYPHSSTEERFHGLPGVYFYLSGTSPYIRVQFNRWTWYPDLIIYLPINREILRRGMSLEELPLNERYILIQLINYAITRVNNYKEFRKTIGQKTIYAKESAKVISMLSKPRKEDYNDLIFKKSTVLYV